MVEQNIFYASLLAIVGGCLQVLTILILAYPEYQRTHHNKNYSTEFLSLLVPSNILFQIIIGVVNTVSTWYGPVSIVIPMRVSSQLIFNMIFFGSLGIESFPKDVKVGTYIVVSGAFLLPIVGPTVQNDQDPIQLLELPFSALWACILVGITSVSGMYSLNFIINKARVGGLRQSKFSILLSARVTSAVLSTSISKFLVDTSGAAFVLTVSAYIACSIVISSVAVLQATEVDQSLFVPASACGIQFINGITGLIIWQDWRVIQSCAGYLIVMAQIVLGVYLISSIDEFAQSADSDYALAQSMTIQTAKKLSSNVLNGHTNSLERYAGGNLKSMLQNGFSAQIIEEGDEEKSENCDGSLDRFLQRDAETDYSYEAESASWTPSLLSYGTTRTSTKFTEDFIG